MALQTLRTGPNLKGYLVQYEASLEAAVIQPCLDPGKESKEGRRRKWTVMK